jgi:ubiquinone/menaquinone biosynthesis C-methylase UbiE
MHDALQTPSISERAFTLQSKNYDANEIGHPILTWMRSRVRRHAMKFLKPSDAILDINAGTGLDAVYFSRRGHPVLATDHSTGMIEQIRKKTGQLPLRIQRCSFTDLHEIEAENFDFVLSNFGGLNCAPDLSPVAAGLPRLLKLGAFVTLVIMPRFCLWEWLLVLKGNFRLATRRLQKKVLANIEGVPVPTFYHSPRAVVGIFREHFRPVALEGLAVISPPPYMKNFALRHEVLYHRLTRIDERICAWPVLRHLGDHYILTLRYVG